MISRRQTSVTVSYAALEQLRIIRRDRAVSRDEAVRQILDEHLDAQREVPEDDRLSHVSTVLRFPVPAPGGPSGRTRLAVRLDPGVAELAVSLALRLPGQLGSRAHRDYAARDLSDAVVTAIARQRPFVEPGLDGLPPLLTHGEAAGLWRLTIAATLTRAEQHALYRGHESAVVLTEENVAWHDPWRSEVAQHLARRLLTGPRTAANRSMLARQTESFRDLRYDLERSDLDHPLLRGLTEPGRSVEGRGGAAVWRADRQLAVTRVGRWVSEPGGAPELVVDPPGWTLAMPPGWHAVSVGPGTVLSPRRAADLAAGRVVRIDAGSRSALWPVDGSGRPVAGVESVVAGAGDVTPADLVEIVLLTRTDPLRPPRVPAATARELSFISAAQQEDIERDAARATRHAVDATLARARRSRLDARDVRALEGARSDPRRFVRLAGGMGLRCSITEPVWSWPVGGIVEALAAGTGPAQLRWLAGDTVRSRAYALERSMESAWHAAFQLGRAYADDGM